MIKKGTVVLVPFPFTDLSGSKVRPAVVISAQLDSDIVLLFITSQQKKVSKHTVVVAPHSENGIKTRSYIVCSKIATIEMKVVLGELGHISPKILQQINTQLKSVLQL